MLAGNVGRFYLFIVWLAFIDALSVAIRFLPFTLPRPLPFLLLSCLAVVFTITGRAVINHQITSELNSTHRDDLSAAYLCGGLGVLLVTIEVIFASRHLSQLNVVFSYEELLIGASAFFVVVRGIRTRPRRHMHYGKFAGVLLLALGVRVAAMVAGCGLASARYAEIVPVVYLGAGNECTVRLDDEFDGAFTTMVGGPIRRLDGRPQLAVCARIRHSGEWVVVDGVLGVENVAGEARLLRRISGALYEVGTVGAPASEETGLPFLVAVAVGHVRVTAAVGDMTGSGVIEIVAE